MLCSASVIILTKKTRLARAVFGPFVWLVLAAAVIPTLALLLVTPTLGARRRVARCAARAFFLLIGSPIRVEGARNLPDEPCVVVANHASYMDGIILTAALPPKFTFLIKAEMTSVPLAGLLLKRIGSAFVDRQDNAHRLRTGRRLLKAAMQGESLAFFPEGTFDADPGLKPFLPGAFAAAWRAGVCPSYPLSSAVPGTCCPRMSGCARPGGYPLRYASPSIPPPSNRPRNWRR